MIAAIAAAIVTLVVAIIVVSVVFVVRNNTKSSNVSVKKDVRSISSVGVKSSLGNAGGHVNGSMQARPGSAQRPASNPADNLKSRFVAMGVLAAGIFGTLTAKLWTMQVLSSDAYRSKADDNQYATVSTPAPRGYICDANGLPLVKNRVSLTVLADAEVANDRDVVQRLSAVLGIPYNVVRQRIQDATGGAQSQRVVASDVRLRDVAFITEHSDAFPGIKTEERYVRDYPYGALAAHVVGYTGSVTEDGLKTVGEGRDVELGDDMGTSGIELQYDRLLAGEHGKRKVVANADGEVVRVVSETQPTKGSDVYLALKGPVQYVADRELAALIAPENGTIGTGSGVAGSVVVMDLRDGGIVAMANYPTFSPDEFTGGVSEDVYAVYNSVEAQKPLLNRAIAGTYPAASTYKTFTGLAALANGFADMKRTWTCGGSWDGWGTGQEQMCWNHSGHGTLDLRGGIVQSCDVVFYQIAHDFFEASSLSNNPSPTASNTALQDYLAKFHFDQYTGIDLGGESVGVIPTPEWKAEHFRNTPEEAVWKGGDMTNMIIGQGYVLVTPLQVAVAYGAVATGKLLKPHLLKEVRNASGDVAATRKVETAGELDVPEENLAFMRDALNGVATDNADVSKLLGEQGIDPATVACKTGTAEYTDMADTAWFACYAPVDDPRYVVTCVVEHGGGGSAVAAPLGAKVLAAALASDAAAEEDPGAGMGVVAGSTGKSLEGAGAATSGGRTD
ncbi:penicillin-binding protein 2 [Eggerthella timonensis]|uniref:penicillin-binding protein 2 n=1 Tax=Eggerthella timonensis TaxID=1871008 RepID=UPI000C757100|nr:penicillin-binding protein 2 [Eggerthella timonensis]